MTFGLFVLLVTAGGAGACLRFVQDEWIRSKIPGSAFPWSTAIINLTGAPVLGFLTGLVQSRIAPTDLSTIIGTGFIGGYTTFSLASYEAVVMIREKRYALAAVYVVGVLVLTVVLAYVGYHYGKQL